MWKHSTPVRNKYVKYTSIINITSLHQWLFSFRCPVQKTKDMWTLFAPQQPCAQPLQHARQQSDSSYAGKDGAALHFNPREPAWKTRFCLRFSGPFSWYNTTRRLNFWTSIGWRFKVSDAFGIQCGLMTGSTSSLKNNGLHRIAAWKLLVTWPEDTPEPTKKMDHNYGQWEDYQIIIKCLPFSKDLGNDDMDGQPCKRMHNRSWFHAISSYSNFFLCSSGCKTSKILKMKGPGVQVAHLRLTLLTNGLQGWTLPSGESSDHGSATNPSGSLPAFPWP